MKVDNDCGYSSMARTHDGKVLILFERKAIGVANPTGSNKDLVLKRFSRDSPRAAVRLEAAHIGRRSAGTGALSDVVVKCALRPLPAFALTAGATYSPSEQDVAIAVTSTSDPIAR